jgi:hypothetical protein
MKKIIRLTEADLTRLVRRVIKEQGAILPGSQQDIAKRAQAPDLESIKKQIVGKKVGLTSITGTFNPDGKDTKTNFQRGDVFTTFLIEDANLSNGRLIMTGKDLKAVDNRGVAKNMLDFGAVRIDSLIFRGCQDPRIFTAMGTQRVGYGELSTYEESKGNMLVSNPTLSDMLFKAFGCAPDIDDTADFQP